MSDENGDKNSSKNGDKNGSSRATAVSGSSEAKPRQLCGLCGESFVRINNHKCKINENNLFAVNDDYFYENETERSLTDLSLNDAFCSDNAKRIETEYDKKIRTFKSQHNMGLAIAMLNVNSLYSKFHFNSNAR